MQPRRADGHPPVPVPVPARQLPPPPAAAGAPPAPHGSFDGRSQPHHQPYYTRPDQPYYGHQDPYGGGYAPRAYAPPPPPPQYYHAQGPYGYPPSHNYYSDSPAPGRRVYDRPPLPRDQLGERGPPAPPPAAPPAAAAPPIPNQLPDEFVNAHPGHVRAQWEDDSYGLVGGPAPPGRFRGRGGSRRRRRRRRRRDRRGRGRPAPPPPPPPRGDPRLRPGGSRRIEMFGDPSELLRKCSDADRSLGEANPHAVQGIQYDSEGHIREAPDGGVVRRILQPETAGRTKYSRRRGHVKSVVHWGQRKLLLSEIEFLTLYAKGGESDVVVYAGAAPGAHTNYLSSLFPFCTFVLVDPAPFETVPSDKILLNPDSEKGFFTDELAKLYSSKYPGCLFISDIRRASWRQMQEDDNERHVLEDMMAQMRWVKLLKPAWSMLKFRLPYSNPTTDEMLKSFREEGEGERREEEDEDKDEDENEGEQAGIRYLLGDIYFPVWGPITTSESRLITNGKKAQTYDHVSYEENLFHFNTVTRTRLYHHSLEHHPEARRLGLDRCYDCASEVLICEAYLKKFDEYSEDALVAMVREIDRQSSRGRRCLRDGNVLPRTMDISRNEKQRLKLLMSCDTAKDSDLKLPMKRDKPEPSVGTKGAEGVAAATEETKEESDGEPESKRRKLE